MILQRLVEYYDRKLAAHDDPIPGFALSRERISFELVIDPSGGKPELNDLRTVGIPNSKKQKPEMLARWMVVPYRGDRSRNIKPNFLWDNTGYVFGRTKKGQDERKRTAFLRIHQDFLSHVADAGLKALTGFLSDWNPEQFDLFQLASEALDENIVVRIKHSRTFVHESSTLQRAWADFFRRDVETRPGTDLISGEVAAVAATHFQIQGVDGAQPTGAAFSSFNDSAYTSYGHESSFNSPVSVDNTFKYTSTLREFLLYERRKVRIGGNTFVFWAEHLTPLEAYASEIFDDTPPPSENAPIESKKRAEEVRLFLSQLREGHAAGDAIDPENSTRFYVLSLAAPAKSRLAVRFWADSTVGEIKARLGQHLRDIDLAGAGDHDPPLIIRRIVEATGRAKMDSRGRFKNYDLKAVSPLLAGAIARAVITGGPYPQMLLTAMLNRIRTDGVIRHERVAAIKGCIVRKPHRHGQSKEELVALDTNRTDSAYVTGRLFALLEQIQRDSVKTEQDPNKELNATIKDRYFSSASATPGIVFPRLIRLNHHHMEKLPTDADVARRRKCRMKQTYERLLDEVVGKLDSFAQYLNLEDQGLFAVGYFHQRQDLFTSKKNEKQGEDE